MICPWAEEHSTPPEPNDTSTVIFEPQGGRGWVFHCSHAHCSSRTLRDVLARFGVSSNAFLPPMDRGGEGMSFRPIAAAELLATPAAPITWVWEPYLPEGALALLAAFMKVGKSTFAYALAIAVARGDRFLDGQTTQGGVLMLAVEEHPRDVKLRLGLFGLLSTDRVHVHTGPLDSSPATLKSIRDYIVEHNIRLVILDTLSRYWRIEDENNNTQVIRALSPLLDLARETGATVLLVHHERKAGGAEGRSIRGGSALFGLVDQALILDRRDGGDRTQRILRTLGRYSESPPEQIIEYTAFRFRMVGSVEEATATARSARVLEAIAATPRDVPTIATASGLTAKQVRPVLAALLSEGQVARDGSGVRGSPHTYRRVRVESIRSRPNPRGRE